MVVGSRAMSRLLSPPALKMSMTRSRMRPLMRHGTDPRTLSASNAGNICSKGIDDIRSNCVEWRMFVRKSRTSWTLRVR